MPGNTPNEITSIRLNAGMYALAKLAGAGLVFLLLSLLTLIVPESNGAPGKDWPVSAPYAVYAYALPAALVADGVLRLLRLRALSLSFLFYAAAGLGAGLWIAEEHEGAMLLCGIASVLGLLVFRVAGIVADRFPLMLPVFALFLPLVCLVLY